MKKTFTAWAIDTQSTEGHGLLGRYFFVSYIPPSSEGCETALFKTRQIARDYVRAMKQGWNSRVWSPKVVKVKVTIAPSAGK